MAMATSATRRLHDLFARLHQEGSQMGGGTSIGDVFKRVLAATDITERELLDIYYATIRQADEAIRELTIVFGADSDDPRQASELNAVLAPIVALRGTLIANSIKSPISALLSHPPSSFHVQAVTASHAVRQREPSAEDIATAKAHLRSALDHILALDISPAIKEAFRAGVERLVRMLEHYQLFGLEGLLITVGQLSSELALRTEGQPPETRQAVSDALARVANAMTIVSSAVGLGLLLRPLVQTYLP